MNNSSDNHEPTPEFRAQLKRDISRAVRNEQRFGSPAVPVDSRRLAMGFGIAAGVVLTLATGMVLGASVSYASAEVVDSSPRPALAILPIGDAINALRCTPGPVEPPARRTAQAATAAPAGRQNVPVDTSVLTSAPAQRRSPDRARIAALATEHQPAIVRGDTAAEYVVMVLDAADQYVWSTIGSGNLSIEVGGDPRTPAERSEYNRQYQAEFWGTTGRGGRGGGGGVLPFPLRHDSLGTGFFVGAKAAALGAGGGARGSGARGGGGGLDTLAARLEVLRGAAAAALYGSKVANDSLFLHRRAADSGAGKVMQKRVLIEKLHTGGAADSLFTFYAGDSVRIRGFAAGARGGGGGRGGVGSNTGTPSMGSGLPGPYKNGWSGTRNGPLFNQASGLEEPTPGQSGIQGLVAASVSSAQTYFFSAAELAPAELKIMVVHLTPGTVWKGP
jgi:hypothetical protein